MSELEKRLEAMELDLAQEPAVMALDLIRALRYCVEELTSHLQGEYGISERHEAEIRELTHADILKVLKLRNGPARVEGYSPNCEGNPYLD